MTKTKAIWVGLLALGVLAILSVPRLSQLVAQQGPPPVQDADITPQTLFTYSGGAQEGVRKRTQNVPTQITSLSYVNLTGATLSWFVPAGDSDLIDVDFEAECRLINSTNDPADWVEIRALITASPAQPGYPTFLEPYDTVSPQALCSANTWAMHHASWARRVAAPTTTGVTYSVQVQWKVTDNFPLHVPAYTAWADDWEMALHAAN